MALLPTELLSNIDSIKQLLKDFSSSEFVISNKIMINDETVKKLTNLLEKLNNSLNSNRNNEDLSFSDSVPADETLKSSDNTEKDNASDSNESQDNDYISKTILVADNRSLLLFVKALYFVSLVRFNWDGFFVKGLYFVL